MSEDKQTPIPEELSGSQRLFRDVCPWLGAAAFGVCGYYALVLDKDVSLWYVGMSGAMMGFGELVVKAAQVRKP